jgi:hypothetical protein
MVLGGRPPGRVGHRQGAFVFHHHDQPVMRWSFCFRLQLRSLPPLDPVPARFPIVAFTVDDFDVTIDRMYLHQVDLPWGNEEDADSR